MASNDERILKIIPWVISGTKGFRWRDRKSANGCLIITTEKLAILQKVSMGKRKKDGTKERLDSSPFPSIPYYEATLFTMDEYSLEDFHKDLAQNEKHHLVIEKNDFIKATHIIKKNRILGRVTNCLEIEYQQNLVHVINKYKDRDHGRELEVYYDHGLRNISLDYDYDWGLVAELVNKHFGRN